MRKLALVSVATLVVAVSACSRSTTTSPISAKPAYPIVSQSVQAPRLTPAPAQSSPSAELSPVPTSGSAAVPEGQSRIAVLSNGAKIEVENRGGILLHKIEGAIAEEAFAPMMASIAKLPAQEQKALVSQEIEKIFGEIKDLDGIGLKKVPEIGYFSFLFPYSSDLMGVLRTTKLLHKVILNPSVSDPDVLENIRAMSPTEEGLVPRNGARRDTRNYSGLERIHAPEFVKLAESDIGDGTKVNGSSVNLGITDTGITLNHRTFMSADGIRNRVTYMKDFTREGRVYFNPAAKFEVSVPENGAAEDLVVNAQVIVTPRLPNAPAGDEFTELKGLKVKVSPEIRAALLAPGSKAKLGFFLESAISAAEAGGQMNDINGNGKVDDQLPMLLIPAANPEDDVVYIDLTGAGDFRNAKALGTWNKTKSVIPAFAEKLGFDIQDDQLPSADGKARVAVRAASVVGFDPDNHGSHVAGIAAGHKTLANDDDDTLARGVAPEANILMNRVCAVNTGCNATEAFIDLALNGGAEVINMSLGGLNPFNDGYGVEETMINRLTAMKNVMFVISAGNSGPGRQTVGSPSVARLSLSVGASATKGLIQRQYQWPGVGSTKAEDLDADFMLFFSSRGPTAAGGFKPNISAPGTELSSVQLNSAPGARGGLDVYWGTSMAAPTATGAYALFLDAVKKFNAKHPEKALASDALTLREVFIQSARPFDMNSFDPVTGARTTGQYTWVDEGMGMVDLVAAWKKLAEVRDRKLPARDGEVPVTLDYQVIVPMKSPSGVAYDGSRAADEKTPAFGSGLYLDFAGTDTLRQVFIQRKLPEGLSTGPNAGELTRALLDTKDEFVLKTTIFGSDKEWVRAGVLDELNCWNSEADNLTVIGRGVDVHVGPDGTGAVQPFNASALNVCINREIMVSQLAPGDHGALISGFRVVNGQVATIPSFTVPVYVTVPHRTLVTSNSYEFDASVSSFGVSRNYVSVPKGTSVVQVTLEVPALKVAKNGLAAVGESCSGVELMMLDGTNTAKPIATRAAARISNCDVNGAPIVDPAKLRLVYAKSNPTPGVWDLHVFGQYKYALSKFKIRVDYINTESSVKKIEGGLAVLNGSFDWKVLETSMPVLPDAGKSSFVLNGLFNSVQSQVAKGAFTLIENPLGVARKYPAEAQRVTITTGGSSGNDLDLIILQCSLAGGQPTGCEPVAASGGPTDEESASFQPKPDKVYVARVDGYNVKDEGKFVSTETIMFAPEKGTLEISSAGNVSAIRHAFGADQLASSKLAKSDLFISGKYEIAGLITLKMANETMLDRIPVRIKQ